MLFLRMLVISVFFAFCGYSDGTIERNESKNIEVINDAQNVVISNDAVVTNDQNIVANEKECKKEPCKKKCEPKKEACPPKVEKPCEPCKKKCAPKKEECVPKAVKPCEPCKKKCAPKKEVCPPKVVKPCEPCKKKCAPKKEPCKKVCKKPCDPCHPCKDPCKRIVDIEIKPCYFYPQDEVFRHVYHKGGFLILGDLDFYVWKNYVMLFFESGYFHRDGTIVEPDSHIHTTVTQVPATIGFGLNYPIYNWWDLYFKLGPNYVYTKATQHSPYFKPMVKKHCFGLTIGIGTKFNFATYGLVDIFVNYRYDRKEIHDSLSGTTFHRFLGGLDIGAGLGVRF